MAKKKFIVQLFNDIAPTYDKLNHILSLNIDKSWRRKAVQTICSRQPKDVLDIASGTGDFAIAIAQAGVPHVMGIDISEGMLQVGRQKVQALGLPITMQVDDSEALSFPDDSFDAVSVAFGVRNFEHLQQGLNEMHRVIRPGGMVCVLELSVPSNAILLALYKLYFLHILPWIGGMISGNSGAYKYLPQSVLNFPKPAAFCDMLRQAGFSDVKAKSFTFGLCRMFTGTKYN
ncbi:MAG: bifunctional demethylmenaquinone methyltransferase/2-methoxy-6-polyprenyl-1,4-benzoquinol methylase UbiE [Bacteroidales bacterium]|nr:bifunctional demethylmenaquinone methyltransferase/2-methoxy-6-polyprenyl-1,4-benzoquinol methylase UbiE [Bacteroidales bacterium]